MRDIGAMLTNLSNKTYNLPYSENNETLKEITQILKSLHEEIQQIKRSMK